LKFHYIKDPYNEKPADNEKVEQQQNKELNTGFSNEVLEKVHFNQNELEKKYNFENVITLWNEIFSSESLSNDTIHCMEFQYLK